MLKLSTTTAIAVIQIVVVRFLAMGMYDSVMVNCPKCGEEREFQSKSGDCFLEVYTLENCPDDVMANVNRHSPCKCDCGIKFEVDIENRKAVVSGAYAKHHNTNINEIKT